MPPAPTGAPGPIQNDRVLLSVIDPKEIYNPNAPKPENSALKSGDTEEEVYCPPSPTPKKSILKDVQYGKVLRLSVKTMVMIRHFRFNRMLIKFRKGPVYHSIQRPK